MGSFFRIIAILTVALQSIAAPKNKVRIYPSPKGETLSSQYRVTANGQEVPVYSAKVGARDKVRRGKAMDDKQHSGAYFDLASFASFDLESGSAVIRVTVPETVTAARILPSSYGIKAGTTGKSVTFTVSRPGNFTIEINGEEISSLHIFVNPPETNIPAQGDPNVIWFGPGLHEVSELVVHDNQTVYLAGGAIVRAVISPGEKFTVDKETGLKHYSPTFFLNGNNITIRGRGIIDASGCTIHARNMIMVTGSNITLEGVILRDASLWTIPIRRSGNVRVNNLKLLGYRANSDGIDICNSRNVVVENCFIRTLDDLVVIKSDKGQGQVKDILVTKNVLWNEFAHALSIGAEIREDVENVVFRDNDIIHDKGREWSLRVYHCDAARISNVRFEDIRIEESNRLISVWIGKAVWSRDADRGNVENVLFKNISVTGGDTAAINLSGFDETHGVNDVVFDNVTLDGKGIPAERVKANAFVKNVRVLP
ncbi:glycosyl hydrolase family 28 protein [Hufsiella ginkgonis]|uniref:Endo-polygalacturonase n=1 Tax=Hufsiella ginkgonis TaxID=2695274 RepID=A0A7K1XSL6_9SPHI|nr:glycosyl hydrolase family 28 protein [Hufsiella ginkgonis]MXV13995.1 endo-polygalacturonase [Hufsiella ginkgonis]